MCIREKESKQELESQSNREIKTPNYKELLLRGELHPDGNNKFSNGS